MFSLLSRIRDLKSIRFLMTLRSTISIFLINFFFFSFFKLAKTEGFTGCVRNLKVNNQTEDLIGEQSTHQKVGQCFPHIERGSFFSGDAFIVHSKLPLAEFLVSSGLEPGKILVVRTSSLVSKSNFFIVLCFSPNDLHSLAPSHSTCQTPMSSWQTSNNWHVLFFQRKSSTSSLCSTSNWNSELPKWTGFCWPYPTLQVIQPSPWRLAVARCVLSFHFLTFSSIGLLVGSKSLSRNIKELTVWWNYFDCRSSCQVTLATGVNSG